MKPGIRVEKTMGVYLIGTVVKHFPLNQATDGTYNPKTKNEVPVEWDDGTKGYINKCYLRIV